MMLDRIKRFWRREDGLTSLEFVIAFPVVIMVFCSAIEAGVMSTRQVMLNRAMMDTSRTLKLASGSLPTQSVLLSRVCDVAVIIPDCENAVTVEVAPIDTVNWNVGNKLMDCADRDNSNYVPAAEYEGGGDNELVMLRLCAVFNPLFPTVGLGAQLRRVNESDYAIVSAVAYVNEPR